MKNTLKKYEASELSYYPSALTLAESLGFDAGDRVLIINGDDSGMCHSVNTAVLDCLENGLMTSSSVMACCPWFPEIANYLREHPQADFGVHLTQTCEWDSLRWGPVSDEKKVPGLVDDEGYFAPEISTVYEKSSPEETEIESRAQIEKALDAGIDVTNLDSHMGTLHYDISYHRVYERLAKEYKLPLRMASREMLDTKGAGFLRDELQQNGIICPDYMIYKGQLEGETTAAYWKRMLNNLRPGVTELFIHAASPGEEIRGVMDSWEIRVEEYRLFSSDLEIRDLLIQKKARLIGWRALRDLQRLL